MITKQEITAVASAMKLLPTTVEKNYVLSWILYGISQHSKLSQWLFKGGTCLKKCYFETYRFSEDLDFTVPKGGLYNKNEIVSALTKITNIVYQQVGITFSSQGIEVKESINKQGNRLCVEIEYDGVTRLVEPYSLRRPRTGNLLLYVYELRGKGVQGIKAYNLSKISRSEIIQQSFLPRYAVEL